MAAELLAREPARAAAQGAGAGRGRGDRRGADRLGRLGAQWRLLLPCRGDICLAHSPAAFAELAKEAKKHACLYGETHELIRPGELAERGLGGRGFHGAMLIGSGFPIHPLAYAEGLARAARDAGAVIFGDSPVTRLSPQDGRLRLESAGGEIIAKRVLIATNGYSSEDLPGWLGGRTLPTFSTIMVTRPITPSEKRAQNFTTQIMSYTRRH